MGFARTGHLPIKSQHFYQAGDNRFAPHPYNKIVFPVKGVSVQLFYE
jgi:hypothetical protein